MAQFEYAVFFEENYEEEIASGALLLEEILKRKPISKSIPLTPFKLAPNFFYHSKKGEERPSSFVLDRSSKKVSKCEKGENWTLFKQATRKYTVRSRAS